MKVAIPVNEKKQNSSVSASFGRAPYFMFYNTQTQEVSFIENSAARKQGGAGIKAAQILVDMSTDVLLTTECGENAAEVLRAAEIKVYIAINNTIQENIKEMEAGKLSPMVAFHAGFHKES